MFAKIYRIKSGTEIESLIKSGSAFKCGNFILRVAPNSLGHMRFAAVLAKKLKLKGVSRNFYKRKILAALANLFKSYIKSNSLDVLIILLAIPQDKVYQVFNEEIIEVLPKLKLND